MTSIKPGPTKVLATATGTRVEEQPPRVARQQHDATGSSKRQQQAAAATRTASQAQRMFCTKTTAKEATIKSQTLS